MPYFNLDFAISDRPSELFVCCKFIPYNFFSMTNTLDSAQKVLNFHQVFVFADSTL
jgi:hypothetical protein